MKGSLLASCVILVLREGSAVDAHAFTALFAHHQPPPSSSKKKSAPASATAPTLHSRIRRRKTPMYRRLLSSTRKEAVPEYGSLPRSSSIATLDHDLELENERDGETINNTNRRPHYLPRRTGEIRFLEKY
ncbi:unnamed protein product [Amoebophrya sp. A25]|nr:unnamed protein product [Amoebophrya sp. A25]|eukprot:GSA25T00002168001.1